MRVNIERERCCGSGQCVVASPDVFDQNDDDGIVVLLQEYPAEVFAESVREAVRVCPTETISIDED